MATDRIIIEGQEVDLQDAVVALTIQSNDVTKPDSIQSNFSNAINLPSTKRNRKILGFADQVNSNTKLPYRVLDAQVYKEGIEVVPHGRGILQNGSFAVDIFSGNANFFEVLGDKKLKDLSFTEFNHIWNYTNVVANSSNNTWQQGFVYDLYDRGKSYNLAAIDWFDLYPSFFARIVWEQIFKEAGFTYSGFSHPLFDKLLLPVSKLYEFDEDFTKPRSLKLAVGEGFYQDEGPQTGRDEVLLTIPFSYSERDPYFSSVNYNKDSKKYTADATYLINIRLKAHAFVSAKIGGVAFELYLVKNGSVIGYAETTTTKSEDLDLTLELKRIILKRSDVLYAQIKLRGYTDIHRWGYSLFIPSLPDLDQNSIDLEVLKEFPQGGEVRLQDWLLDISQKDYIKSMVHLFGLTFQTDLYQNNIRINTFNKVTENIPQAIDISKWVHEPEKVRPSFKFGDFAQKNKIIWQPDETVTEGYNDGVFVVDDTTLEVTKDIIKLPYAATEARGNLLYIPLWKVRTGTNPVEYDSVTIKPRLVVQGDSTLLFTIVERDIKRDANNVVVSDQIINSSAGMRPMAYHVDGSKLFDLNIQDYIIPTFYPTLLNILDNTKVLAVQVKTPAQFIQDFDQSVPVWVDYWQQYFYVNKINEFINSYSLTDWVLVRI